jgi:cytochrome oxidase Cu insertion factor (SCO1/SenC/PrrC family)
MNRPSSLSVISISLAALMAIAAAAWIVWHQLGGASFATGDSEKTGFRPAVEIGGHFSLVDDTGAEVTDADFRGKYMLVYFGYTYCPDICPTGLATIANALKQLGKEADKIQPLFVTVDPERDTPKQLAQYVSHFYPTLRGLTGSEAQIAEIAKRYRVFRRKVTDTASTDYLMDHSTFFYLMRPDGKLALMFRHGTEAGNMAAAIAEEIEGKS